MMAVNPTIKMSSLDWDLVRRYYRNPQSVPASRMPTDEELVAEGERLMVEFCLQSGDDPVKRRLGEHNSLFGSPEKPSRTYFNRFPSYMPPLAPPPLEWFRHPRANRRPPCAPDETHMALDMMLARHLAGVEGRPSAQEMAAILRKPTLSTTERIMTYHLFGCISPQDMFRLLWNERLTLFELVRALHNSGIQRHCLSRSLEQYAVRPPGANQS